MSDPCEKCGRPVAEHIPVLEQTSGPPYKTEFGLAPGNGRCPAPAEGLDFEAAEKAAMVPNSFGADAFLVVNDHLYELALNAQAVALRDQAVRETEAKYSPLVAAWKEWKAAHKEGEAIIEEESTGGDYSDRLVANTNRIIAAHNNLAAVEDVCA